MSLKTAKVAATMPIAEIKVATSIFAHISKESIQARTKV